MYPLPINVTSFSTVVAVAVIHIAFGASAPRSCQSVAVVVSASSVVASTTVAS